jgi:hypothetical protein
MRIVAGKGLSLVASKGFALGWVVGVVSGAIVLQVLLHGPSTGTPYALGGTGGAGSGAQASSARAFTIEGNATEAISPGARAALDVRLSNPHDFAMSVADLRVSVQKVSAPNADPAHPCAVGDFTVDQASIGRKVTVAAGSTTLLSGLGFARATWPEVGMLNRTANQDGCKGASLTLAYTASGTAEQ